MAPDKKSKTVFVTVGTTLFESLIAAVLEESALQWMVQAGYTHLVIQYGKGIRPMLEGASNNAAGTAKHVSQQHHQLPLNIELYDFKPSLQADMQRADLLICHAGAGTLMEGLTMQRKIVTVINTILMDNHQTEVAHALARSNLVYVVDCASQLEQKWTDIASFEPSPFVGGDAYDVPRLLDAFFGFKDS
jgi:beta-1,4-N-acetylglucosaminyltransferase